MQKIQLYMLIIKKKFQYPEEIHINSSVAQLLNISEVKDHKNFIKQADYQVNNLLSTSIQELLTKYEKDVQAAAGDKSWMPNRRITLKRMHSDSIVKLRENDEDLAVMDLNQTCFGRISKSPSASTSAARNDDQNYPEDIDHQYYPTPSKKINRSKSFSGKFQQLQNSSSSCTWIFGSKSISLNIILDALTTGSSKSS